VTAPDPLGHGAVQVRVARPSRRFRAVVAFYGEALGLPCLASWEDHDGFDGAVFGLPDASRQLEILHAVGVEPRPTSEDQLVLYLGSAERVRAVADRLRAAGHQPRVSANPYWERDAAVCFVDPDGYWLVLSPSSWG
jgi:catechol 2,3-dioxygenase-like lactoylglutathione lyase family enzyme